MKRKGDGGILQRLVKKKILICVILVLLYIGVMVSFAIYNCKSDTMLESVYYLSQIICGIFVITGTVIAVIQYTFNSNIAKMESDKQRKIQAAKLADEFRQTIIPAVNKVSMAFKEEKIRTGVIDFLDNTELVEFNKDEVERLFPEEGWLKYRVMVAQSYLKQTDGEINGLSIEFRSLKEKKGLTEEEKYRGREIEEILNKSVNIAHDEISSLLTELANSLEYMCICFNTNIADDETVYQSLHKVFFFCVHMIYIFVFVNNENEHDRLFYNIMVLYKKWKKLNREKKAQEERNKAQLEEKMRNLRSEYGDSITVKTKCE